jgi:hypothetical protein
MHSLVSNPALFASALALCSSFAAAPLDAQTPANIPSFLLRVGKAGTVTPVPMGITADHARMRLDRPTVLDNAANPKQLDIAFSVAATRKDQLKTIGKHWRFTISIVRK